MESVEPKIQPKEKETQLNERAETIESAQRSVRAVFEEKLAHVLDELGRNPYYSDIERTIS